MNLRLWQLIWFTKNYTVKDNTGVILHSQFGLVLCHWLGCAEENMLYVSIRCFVWVLARSRGSQSWAGHGLTPWSPYGPSPQRSVIITESNTPCLSTPQLSRHDYIRCISLMPQHYIKQKLFGHIRFCIKVTKSWLDGYLNFLQSSEFEWNAKERI